MDKIRVLVEVGGIVQGVGFRPFIHRKTEELALSGFIRNTTRGAEMELEGERDSIACFLASLTTEKPALAEITDCTVKELPTLRGDTEFSIAESLPGTDYTALVSPDVCICDDCLRELFDPNDRRYRFPFINCTNCGPRFTIVKDLPYDRKNTTMAAFPMCESCLAEYGDIRDRRYHAQPDCCADCGPKLFFADAEGASVSGDAIALAQELLRNGKILAVKGLGGIHLACLAENEAAVRRLRERKHREEKPLALMCADVETAERFCFLESEERAALESFRRPIVLLKKRTENSFLYLSENTRLGIMLPYTPVHYLLLHDDLKSLVMTSANLSDRPILYRNEEALRELRGIADGFLLHNREIFARCDDSLLWLFRGKEYFARRSRGYAPHPLSVPAVQDRILACGAEQKASFCLSKDGRVFPSPHIGDLKNLETLDAYQRQIARYEQLFDSSPALIVCDAHPDYLSGNYAEQRAKAASLPLLRVQHHFAHMVSCMADNGLTGRCIGLVWDGTGYGDDGTSWGSEFFTGDCGGYERRGSILPIPLAGGDRAVKEIWRIGGAMASEIGELSRFAPAQRELLQGLLSLNLNCPKAQGMGRLFDGVASLLGLRESVSYEGQGACLLEAATGECDTHFSVRFSEENGLWLFDWREMLRELLCEKDAGVSCGILAAKFMNTLVEMAALLCGKIREATGLNRVVLSGGTFQNIYLLSRLMQRLEDEGFCPFCHQRVSANDEGLSLGQTVIAQEWLRKSRERSGE